MLKSDALSISKAEIFAAVTADHLIFECELSLFYFFISCEFYNSSLYFPCNTFKSTTHILTFKVHQSN